ncbi:MAG: carboxypeptidase-like regulatory domain-containing protein [Solirubrobacteraceae bacterium]
MRSGKPIAGQSGGTYVVQAADEGQTISCAVTAANGGGDYTIMGLASGSYKVDFFAGREGFNYLSQYFSGKMSSKEANLVSVTAPNATGGVSAELHSGGQISGRVVGAATHAALAGIFVCAGQGGEGLFSGCAETNSNGEYTIEGLDSGSYVVEFFPFLEEGDYLGQYYSGKTSESEANRVGVTAGSTTASINAELQPGGGISGRVTDTSAHPLEKIEVCAVETTDHVNSGCASTNGNGEYTIAGLPTSSYDVEFEATSEGANYERQFWNEKASSNEAEAVVVDAPTTTPNIDAKMNPAGQIGGIVTDASSHARLSKIEVCAEEGAVEYFSRCASTNGNGEYTIAGLAAGSHQVLFRPGYQGGDYVSQYWNDKSSGSEAEDVSVTLGTTQTGIDAEMHAGGGVAGRVTDATSHAPIEKAEVCVGARYAGCAVTNANGEYAVSQLESGSYTVEVTDPQEGSNYMEQAVHGVSVVAPGTTSPINVELYPGGQISGVVTDAITHTGIAGIEVCAEPIGKLREMCATTTSGAGSVSATSNALSVPSGDFIQTKSPVFNAKKGVLEFFFRFPTAGKLHWALFFRNSDVGFADSMGLSLRAEGVEADLSTGTLAEAARRSKKGKKCKKDYTEHGHRCVRLLVPFGSGSQDVAAGTVEIKVHASSKAIKALKTGRTLHVSGTFTFQSALGGPPVRKVGSAVVRLPKHAKKHGKGKRR